MDAGRLAATGGNRQPWDFIVVTDREMIDRLKVAAAWLERAGAIIAVVKEKRPLADVIHWETY